MTKGKLEPEFKQKWIAALRSGKYTQIQSQLFGPNPNEACCLGVACDITGHPNDHYGYDHLEQFGISYTNKLEAAIFYRLNDFENKSFSEIADYIEANC